MRNCMKGIGNFILEGVFPRRCPVCDRPVRLGEGFICKECRSSFLYIGEPRCKKCGKRLKNDEDEYCFDCFRKKHFYDCGLALYEYRSVRQAVYRFKYEARCEYADFFGLDIARFLGEDICAWKPDALVPVPLHSSRQRKRGYNQAELLADSISRNLSIPVENKLVIRGKNTIAQKKLNEAERQNNLKKAFIICENVVKLKTIILIDDIYTTGSTVDALALELKRAGVGKVYFVALSIGEGI